MVSSHDQSQHERAKAAGGEETCYQDITAAQAAWGEAILCISNAYLEGNDYVETAQTAIQKLYAYDVSSMPVMFKPTLASVDPFRPTFEGALSYFVGYDAIKPQGFKEDGGFAINKGEGWKKVEFDNDEYSCVGDFLFVHGYYNFTNAKTSAVISVEYSFGYKKGHDGLKIFIHTSTLPYDSDPSSLVQKTEPVELLKEVKVALAKKTEETQLMEEAKGLKECCNEDIHAAQAEWGSAILKISEAYPQGYVQVAERAIAALYGYEIGPVLFKPTKAELDPFRPTSIGALSYFVGYDALKPTGFQEDMGFAINGGKGWTKVRFDNNQTFCKDGLSVAQGYYYFTSADTNAETGVEYTFVYKQVGDKLKIMLHHSSLPFSPQ